MELCARCHKRVAVVFVTRLDGNKPIQEGICLKCAKELGIRPVSDILNKMGIDDAALDSMDDELEDMMQNGLIPTNDDDSNDSDDSEKEGEEGRAPAVDINRLFSGMVNGTPVHLPDDMKEKNTGEDTKEKKEKRRAQQKKRHISSYCMDLTARARAGELDAVIGRERELARMTQILCRRQKNNPCLIGEPGVGKTAIAEALAIKIAKGDVPYKLRDKEIQLLDLTAMVAGTQFRGQFESRMKGLIEEIKALGNIILVIDEVHNLTGAGDAEGSMNAANILKPALSRGEIQVIGATTLTEYRKYIEKDAALERRFQPIMVNEPSVSDTIEILDGIKGYYEKFHGIHIPHDTIKKAVIMSERYITDRFLPDKAIDLLDESSAYLALHSPIIRSLDEVTASLQALRTEKEALESEKTPDTEERMDERFRRLAELKSREIQLNESFEKLSEQRDSVQLGTDDLAQVIEIWTGIPASTINQSEFERLDQMEARLKTHIVGQDEAVSAVVRAIKRNRAGVAPIRKPVSFIFAGPTGVGKTELVKQLALDMFQSPEALIRLDMSEFMEKHAVSRIIGSPPGYVGYDDAGQLTEKIRRKPYSVVLFDEIEKAHPDVMNILLQILDEGRITDSHGKLINFENTVIVMTTNAGSNTGSNPVGFGSDAHVQQQNRTEKALLTFLRPEFINRVDEIITFRQLSEQDFVEIAKIMLGQLLQTLNEKDITLTFTQRALEYIAHESYSAKYGARNMRRYIRSHVEDEIAQQLISRYQTSVHAIILDVKQDDAGQSTLSVEVS